MRRWLLLWVLLLAACGNDTSNATPKEYVWSRFDSAVAVHQDGILQVEETLSLRYTGGPWTFAFRDLPQRRLDTLDVLEVRDAEQVYTYTDDQESSEPYTYSVFYNDGDLRIRWVYPPTSDTERTFTISYRVEGAVRQNEGLHEIWWSFVPPQRDVAVERARATLNLPPAVPAESINVTTPDVAGTIEQSGSRISATTTNVAPGAEFTLRASFPDEYIVSAPPAWQQAIEAQELYNRTTRPRVNSLASAAAAACAVLLLLVFGRWVRNNRDPKPQGFHARQLPTVPDDLPPALAGKLINQSNAQLFLATIFDLAQRGYLVLQEAVTKRKNTFVLQRTPQSTADLQPFEANVLHSVFGDDTSVPLRSHNKAFIKGATQLGKWAEQELIVRGLLDAAALKRQKRGVLTGSLLLLLGGISFFISMFFAGQYSWWLIAIPLVFVIVGVIWLATAYALRGTTPSGANHVARWKAFQRYLKDMRLPPEQRFDQLLPYATAIADPQKLTKTYSQSDAYVPVWFYPHLHTSADSAGFTPQHGGANLLLQDFQQNFISALSSASTSATSASSSGGAGGGGGASGGGGAGAG